MFFFAEAWRIFKAFKWPLKILVGLIALVILLFLFNQVRSCFTPTVTIDEEALQKINSQIEANRKAELEVIIRRGLETGQIVDERNRIQANNEIETDKRVKELVDEADAKIKSAQNTRGDIKKEELECLLLNNC